jgi:hypothetical protein
VKDAVASKASDELAKIDKRLQTSQTRIDLPGDELVKRDEHIAIPERALAGCPGLPDAAADRRAEGTIRAATHAGLDPSA